MTFEVVRFGWDGAHHRPLIEIEDDGDAQLPPKFRAFGAEYEDADTMFAVMDQDDNRAYISRPEPLHIEFLDGMIAAGALTVVMDEFDMEMELDSEERGEVLSAVAAISRAIANGESSLSA
jgi:hypothetical protein